ncbi:UNVERIFIED_CONTAM: hypothetical protein GTU68_034723 [Idotea baltica]|nr:hypothetical protein [Idotea baltica]
MIESIIRFSLKNKLIVLLFTVSILAFGLYAVFNIPIGAVPDVTNNQVQVITTSRNLSTQDVEQFITYPVELEMSNLPGVKEIRSISKFGLSVVTIVFEDNMGTYLPRQLLSEKIKSAAENIPEAFGVPEMGPITTGLGEIYQYVLEVEPAYQDQYSIMQLRTIQDWIVRRQLSGIPGVVEVNTWGGELKQYQVTVNPEQLSAMNLSLAQVYQALNMNNSVAGGGYIEKSNQAYFIRGDGLAKTLADIEDIVVDNREGIPVYIKDIGTVGFGSATRFGAITGNGEGEKVLGQVMMIKDGDSKAVIEAVKERVAEVQSSLPPGISINPFLERSELIERTTSTIVENLYLGCLIVIFVVVLLLGNLRTGLVVASVIPICLLFAISLMYIFGVDANLMSLGAIDFGIIIDGAVIIVEFIAFQITSRQSELLNIKGVERQKILNQITFEGTKKMMHSAVFGQFIIILVFIPILSLINVEGKMFRPMALTFCFALLGAILLCFTYVPVVSSLFLKPSSSQRRNLSTRMVAWLQRQFRPVLTLFLQQKFIVLGTTFTILIFSGFLFSTLGGEFVPTLDEGDFVIQPVLKTGTSLSKTIETTTRIESVIKEFPEVRQVVTRIGAAEVPTDPMSMEETDVIITLKPKSEWVSAASKDELADKLKNALQAKIPNIDYEFTQPIEMRFNELITGVRADIAIKIFGDDLNVLARKAAEVATIIENVEGASDISVEKIEGLPQMSVVYDRKKIARYGLNVSAVNDIISMGFAGKVAGSIFEGERRFDLVLRYGSGARTDLSSLQAASVTTPNGQQVPLSELAQIEYTTGPAKISRDDTKRRVVVGVNVRNRDLESVVEEVKGLIKSKVDLPPGYHVVYGGQFENLQSARDRLTIAVPVALLLIFIMLYFALKSIKEALMVFSAIPFASVGGIVFLYFRGMPFSISAGVGFIALFGIAVLNGLVLLEHYKELQNQGRKELKALVIEGTVSRLRPVLLTAAAAALGFLPMAISHSAGAEVQRPLATVVIGGLITSTLLTLIVLPVLYSIFSRWKGNIKAATTLAGIAFLFLPAVSLAQSPPLSLEEAIHIAKANNKGLEVAALQVSQQEALLGSAFNFEKTNVYFNYDENNIALNNRPLQVWGAQQNFAFPTSYRSRQELQNRLLEVQQGQFAIEERVLEEQVSKQYGQIIYLKNLKKEVAALDSIYTGFSHAARRRYELGEISILEKLTAEEKHNHIKLELNAINTNLEQAHQGLARWLQMDSSFTVRDLPLEKVEVIPFDTANHPGIAYHLLQSKAAAQAVKVKKDDWLPDIQVEYFLGTNQAPDSRTYSGFQLGLGLPILSRGQKSLVNAAQIEESIARTIHLDYQEQVISHHRQLNLELEKYDRLINYYHDTGKALALALINSAKLSYENGDIDFFRYVQTLDQGAQIKMEYLSNLRRYNETALTLNFLMN